VFGFNSEVKNNLIFLDDNTVIYPCGQNVVIYRIDDKSQRFIPAIQGAEGITCLAISKDRKTLAVCERAPKALCVIYNVGKMLEQIIEEVKMKKVTSIFTKIIEKKKVLVSSEI